ncbi:MAG: NADP-dependent glyceraldehyde-3-phosphate dehydrogenase [Bacteroidia bacterium]|jgi:glyceraldehyde-3-phosphate dehydrogenase (NADP+)
MKESYGFFSSDETALNALDFKALRQDYFLADGQIQPWNGAMQQIISPVWINNEPLPLGAVPSFDAEKSISILDAAVKAWDLGRGQWPTLRVMDRIAAVERFLERFKTRRQAIVRWLMLEIGKNKAESEYEFDRTTDYIVDTIAAVKKLDRESSNLELHQGIYAQVRRAPLGVVLCMAPYNYPLNESFATLLPALIMGNTVVFKPARYGILVLEPLLEDFKDCFPPGVINFVYGDGQIVVKAIMETGKVDVLAFIGSSKTAASIKKLHPQPHRLRSVLGLDAKNPAIILADADLDNAVNECVNGSLAFNGQRCTALKILFVHETIAAAFLEKFVARVNHLKAGMPWTEGVFITPLPESNKPAFLQELIADALSKGAQLLNEQAGRVEGSMVLPAVLFPVNANMRVYHEEQFGPIVPVCTFSNIQEVINYITHSPYGQQVSVFSQNPEDLSGLIDPLINQVCRININTKCQRGPDVFPFNGRKDSAEGTLSVHDALRVFSIRTMVATRDNESNRKIFSTILDQRMSHFLNDQFLL